MKQAMLFAAILFVALVVVNLQGQSLKPYNAFVAPVEKLFCAPHDLTQAAFRDSINKYRDFYKLPYLGLEAMRDQFLPQNIWNNNGVISRGRTFPISYNQFKSDFWTKSAYVTVNGNKIRYKIWHYANVEPLGFNDFSDASVAARILPKLLGVGVYIPNAVQKKLMQLLSEEHQYQSGEFIPGDILLFSSYKLHGEDIIWPWTVVAATNSEKGFAREYHIQTRQLPVSHDGLTYVFCFVRGRNSTGWTGCNNFGCFVIPGDYGKQTDKTATADKGEGFGDIFNYHPPGESNQGPDDQHHTDITPNPNPPEHQNPQKPCDTAYIYRDGKVFQKHVNCGGNIIVINIDNNNTNCCPPAGGTVIPPVVIPLRKDTLVVIPITPVNPGPVIPNIITPTPIPIIGNGTATNQPCDCYGPLLEGFIYFQASSNWDVGNTRNADFEGGFNIYPTKSWWGVGVRSQMQGWTEPRGEATTGSFLLGPVGRFYLSDRTMARVHAGYYGNENDMKWRLLRFDNMPWRPVPVNLPYNGLLPIGFTVKNGGGINFELFSPDVNFEGRIYKGWNKIQYLEMYGDVSVRLSDNGYTVRGWYWRQVKGGYTVSAPNDFGGTSQFYIAPTLGEEWGVQYRFPLSRPSSQTRQRAIVARYLGVDLGGARNSFDGNDITGYAMISSQYLGSNDFYGWRRGLGFGVIFNNTPWNRCFLELRGMYFPAKVADYEVMQNFERKPVFSQGTNGLWQVDWMPNYSGHEVYGLTLAFSYWF